MNIDNTLKKRKTVYKLAIARYSIGEAIDSAKALIDICGEDHNHPLFRPLHAALVISYGRAYSNMEPFGIISSKWSEFKSADEQRAHLALLAQRNKMVGHSDYIPERVMVYPKGTEMPNGDIAESMKIEVLTNYINPRDIRFIINMMEELFARMSEGIHDGMTELYGELGKDLDKTLELIKEDELRDSLKSSSVS